MACDIKCKKCGSGIMPRQRFYRCLKCGEHVFQDEIEEKRCPLCLNVKLLHKDCGGAVVEADFFRDVKIR